MAIEIYKNHNVKKDINDHHKMIPAAVNDHIIVKLKAEDRFISYDEVVSLMWDEHKIAQMKGFMREIITTHFEGQRNLLINQLVTVANPALPEATTCTVGFKIHPPKEGMWPWPAQWAGTFSHPSPRLATVCQAVADNALDRGLLRKVTRWLLNNCKTHEQATWLFPSWATICRRSDVGEMRNIGVALTDISKPRILPPVPPAIRPMLRYLHTFMAGHELMGTFDKDPQRGHYDLCTISLNGTHEVTQNMGDLIVDVNLI